jgi:hypothetical protein
MSPLTASQLVVRRCATVMASRLAVTSPRGRFSSTIRRTGKLRLRALRTSETFHQRLGGRKTPFIPARFRPLSPQQ